MREQISSANCDPVRFEEVALARVTFLVWLVCLLGCGSETAPQPVPDYLVSGESIGLRDVDLRTFFPGCPTDDCVDALSELPVIAASEADYLRPDDRVIGVRVDGVDRAYPVKILWWHQALHDTLANKPIIVTHSPVSGSSRVFDARLAGAVSRFEVSGRFYNSCSVFVDSEAPGTEQVWLPQMYGATVTGSGAPERWPLVPSIETTWAHWRSLRPETSVVSDDTGYRIDYDRYPFGNYPNDPDWIIFPLSEPPDGRYPWKEPTLGVGIGKGSSWDYRAYPYSNLGRLPRLVLDSIGGEMFGVVHLPESGTWALRVPGGTAMTLEPGGKSDPEWVLVDSDREHRWNLFGDPIGGEAPNSAPLPWVAESYSSYWFTMAAFHPGIATGPGARHSMSSRR